MSGGFFDYQQFRLRDMIDQIERVVESNNSRNFSKETIAALNDAIYQAKRAEAYLQRVDWLLSDDEGEDTFHIRLKADLEKLNETL